MIYLENESYMLGKALHKAQKFARETGIPTSKAGLERKIGKSLLKAIFGK